MLNEKTQNKGPRVLLLIFFVLYKEVGLFVIAFERGAAQMFNLGGLFKDCVPSHFLKAGFAALSRLWVYVRYTTIGIEIGSLTTKRQLMTYNYEPGTIYNYGSRRIRL